MILREFDPWKSRSCSCPPKHSLNPYTGCAHGCLYCYASSYILRFSECRPKVRLLAALKREVCRLEPGILISMANSSDPYPPMERDLQLTRGCIQILKERELRLQVVTKSDIVSRDADLLSKMPSVVSITLTTLCDDLSSLLEPGAPKPGRRLDAMRGLWKSGVAVSARLDPIIPGINDLEIEELVMAVCNQGAQHITSSTFKARPDSWRRIKDAFPREAKDLGELLDKGSRIGGYRYLPQDLRAGLMQKVKNAAIENGVTFSTCREGFANDPKVSCDGSHLAEKNCHHSSPATAPGYGSH